MRIIGPPSAKLSTVERWLGNNANVHHRFMAEMLDPLWIAAERYTIDPVGVIAQAGKETGWGHYPGKVKPEFYNTGGVKVRHLGLYPGIDDNDNPLAHQRFASWEEGAIAHVQHVRAYTGWPVPHGDRIASPRYHLVLGVRPVENWSEFGGYDAEGRIQWAPSETYGAEVEAIMTKMRSAV